MGVGGAQIRGVTGLPVSEGPKLLQLEKYSVFRGLISRVGTSPPHSMGTPPMVAEPSSRKPIIIGGMGSHERSE